MIDFNDAIIHLHKAYNALVLGKKKSYKWKGPLLTTKKILASCPNIDQKLNADNIKADKEQGRTKVDVILSTAMQLGIQQGIDLAKEDYESLVDRMETNSERILFIIANPSKTHSLEMIEQFAKDMRDTAQRKKKYPL